MAAGRAAAAARWAAVWGVAAAAGHLVPPGYRGWRRGIGKMRTWGLCMRTCRRRCRWHIQRWYT